MRSKIKVLHIIAVPMTGVKIVAPIAQRQSQLGYIVEFACGPGEFLEELSKLGFPITIIPIARRLFSIKHLFSLWQLQKHIRTEKYQIVHTHTPIASFLGRLAAYISRTPIIIYHMRTSWWDADSALIRFIFTTLERLSGIWTSHIFTINAPDTNDVIKYRIVSPEKVSCLHSGGGGIDLNYFDPAKYPKIYQETMRAELGIKSSEYLIGFIGRIVWEKGIFELISAFQGSLAEIPNAKLLLIGGVLSSERDQKSNFQIQELISNQQLSDKIIFTGFRDDIPELLSIMDVVVLPSYREGFGLVLAEAAAMGKAVISTSTRGGRETILDGKNGLLVPIGDITALKEAIIKLSNTNLQKSMGKEGRKIAQERFDENIVFAKIQAEYDRLLQDNGLLVSDETH